MVSVKTNSWLILAAPSDFVLEIEKYLEVTANADAELLKKKITLADFLKQKRIAAGLSQADVADKLGYSTPQFISNWERGVSRPPISVLKKLGELFKASSEDLFEVVLNETISEVTQDFRNKFWKSKK